MQIPHQIEITKVAEPANQQAREGLEAIEALEITTHEAMATALQVVAEIKNQASQVDEARRSFVDPLRQVVDDINKFFRPALDRWKSAERILKRKISDYNVAQLAERDRCLARVGATPAANHKKKLIKQAEKAEPPQLDGLSIRETWTGEVIDPQALMEWAIETKRLDLLTINEKALRALTKAAGKDPQIPGWQAFANRVVAVTASKVQA